MQSLRPTCNVAACGFKAVKLLVMLGPLFRGDGPYVWTSWKNKNKKKTLNNQSEDFKNKARHLPNKNLASRETKLDRDKTHPAPTSLARTLWNTNLLPRCASASWDLTALHLAFKRALSSPRAATKQFPAADDCLQPGQDARFSAYPVWTKYSPGSPVNKWDSMSLKGSHTEGERPTAAKETWASHQYSKTKTGTANKKRLVLSDKGVKYKILQPPSNKEKLQGIIRVYRAVLIYQAEPEWLSETLRPAV